MEDDQNETYPVPTETMRGLPWAHHLSDIMEVMEFCERLGIRTKNTRLERYGEFLRRFLKDGQVVPGSVFVVPSDSPFENYIECLQYVLREVHELMWILKGLQVRQPEGLEKRLERIVGGRDFAFLDADSKSRDAQFELRIASYFCQSGCYVDLTTDTDVIVHSDDFVYFIECKRVGSSNQLRKRLSGAKEQLRKRMPKKIGEKLVFGCVAVDVTKVGFPHNGCTFGAVADHSKEVIQSKLKDVCNTAEGHNLFGGGRGLIVYWFQIHIASFVMFPNTLTSRFSSNHIYKGGMVKREFRAANNFWDLFRAVSTDDSRSSNPKPLRRRKSFTLPAGTQWYMDEQLMQEILSGEEIAKRNDDFVVGGMEYNGIDYEFLFFEFMQALDGMGEDEIAQLVEDPIRAQVIMLALMCGRRNPFEVVDDDESEAAAFEGGESAS